MKQRMLWDEPVEIVDGHPVLFPFQSDLLERGRKAFEDGTRRVIWQASCGAGKTVIAAEQTKRALEKNKTVLHIVHRRRLVDQMIGVLKKFEINAAPIMEGRLAWNSKIKCASRDTLLAMVKDGADLPRADLIIWDECHVASQAVQDWYLRFCPRSFWVGYTATPVGADGKSLRPPYQKLVCCAPTSELLKAGRLCPVKVFNPDSVGRKRRKGEKVKPAGDPVAHWLQYCKGVPTVAFAATVAQSRELVQRYIARGITAEHIDANTPEDERERVFERSQSGDTTIISNVGVMIEGVDLPWLVCCQILRGCNSLVFWFQATGRIMRVYPGKLFGIVLDHSAAAFDFFRPDDDVTWSLEDGATNERKNMLPKDRKPIACMKCGFVFVGKPACPECGKVLAKQRRKTTLANMVPDDAILTEFTEGQRLDIQQDAMRRMWNRLLYMGKAKGWPMGRIAGIFTKNAKRPPWEANLDVPLPHGKQGWAMPVEDWMEALANDPQEMFKE